MKANIAKLSSELLLVSSKVDSVKAICSKGKKRKPSYVSYDSESFGYDRNKIDIFNVLDDSCDEIVYDYGMKWRKRSTY